jgi:hypothetical protein
MSILNSQYQKTTKKTLQAFTLVELLIYMSLFTGFLMLLSALFVSILDTQLSASINSHLDQDSSYLISRLQYDIYRAESISTPTNRGDESDSLVLELASSSISYSLSDNQLLITENGQSYNLLNPSLMVSNTSFKKLGNENGSSTITVDLEITDLANRQTKQLHFTLGLR